MSRPVSDTEIERLEADLNESRFKPWDVETFLANRHRAKIEELTEAPDNPWRRRWAVTKELAFGLAAFIGYCTIVSGIGIWLLTGRLYIPPFVFGL